MKNKLFVLFILIAIVSGCAHPNPAEIEFRGPGIREVEFTAVTNSTETHLGCIEGWIIDEENQVGLGGYISIQKVAGQTWHDATQHGDLSYNGGHFEICNLPIGNYVVRADMGKGLEPLPPTEIEVTLNMEQKMHVLVILRFRKK